VVLAAMLEPEAWQAPPGDTIPDNPVGATGIGGRVVHWLDIC
jgi:hypothetical protein